MTSRTWREASRARTSSFSRPRPNGATRARRALTADERAAAERRRTLELSLMRAKGDLATARTGAHRRDAGAGHRVARATARRRGRSDVAAARCSHASACGRRMPWPSRSTSLQFALGPIGWAFADEILDVAAMAVTVAPPRLSSAAAADVRPRVRADRRSGTGLDGVRGDRHRASPKAAETRRLRLPCRDPLSTCDPRSKDFVNASLRTNDAPGRR